MTEEAARKEYGEKLRVVRLPFSASDRAQTEGATAGTVKLVVHGNGHILGASILGGAHAGELAHLWVVAIEQKFNLRNIAQMMAPYPTLDCESFGLSTLAATERPANGMNGSFSNARRRLSAISV
ncbi:hypothetical protein [Bradyrhizobium sediminis]|nr:hypothetical protein [Bradyrhizobium sediminis]